MRVMTWNVWGRFGPWQQREPALIGAIAGLRPDAVGLQETWIAHGVTQAEVIGAHVGLHHTFCRSRMPTDDDPDVELGLAVLTRWPIVDVEHHVLSRGPEGDCVALSVVADHPGGPLHLVNVCLDWEQDRDSQRLAQVRALRSLLTDSAFDGPLPVVLVGDLNQRPDAVEIEALASAPMVDCWSRARPGEPGYTFSADNGFVPADDWHADGRIDYVLARPGTAQEKLHVQDAAVAGVAPPGEPPPSDHYAVVVTLDP